MSHQDVPGGRRKFMSQGALSAMVAGAGFGLGCLHHGCDTCAPNLSDAVVGIGEHRL